MLIDWFTVAAQVINFMVLVYLLNKFLFTPILARVDQRREEQQRKEKEADKELKEARGLKEEYEEKMHSWEQERKKILDEARSQASSTKDKLLAEAKEEVAQSKEKWLAGISKQQKKKEEQIKGELQKTAFAITRKILQELADSDLQEKIIKSFIERLKVIDKKEIANKETKITVISAFPISDKWRQQIEDAVTEIFGQKDLEYNKDEELLGGLKIESGSFQLIWGPQRYLEELELSLEQR